MVPARRNSIIATNANASTLAAIIRPHIFPSMAIYDHPCFIPPKKDLALWRYMDLKKYQSFLETSSLFFCRADKFIDPFEGSLPKIEADYRIQGEKIQAAMFNRKFNKSQAQRNISGLKKLHQRLKRGEVINCWHSNRTESDAMWQLYLKDNEGVAIQTTVEKLSKAIETIPEKIGISKVRYLNYEEDRWYHPIDYPEKSYNLYIPIVHKRIEFIHENEVRLIHDVQDAVDNEDYWDNQPNHIGKLIAIDIGELVEKIILPPTIDAKTTARIKRMTKMHGYNFKFEKSKLSKRPWY